MYMYFACTWKTAKTGFLFSKSGSDGEGGSLMYQNSGIVEGK